MHISMCDKFVPVNGKNIDLFLYQKIHSSYLSRTAFFLHLIMSI